MKYHHRKEQLSDLGEGIREMSEEKKGGLEFMATRYNVIDTRRQLSINKEVTPSEYFLLEEIELGTIGARNKGRQICSKAEFSLDQLSKNLGYKEVNKLWPLLKSLEGKKLIIREKSKYVGFNLLGLNPEKFGQILINTQHEAEQKRKLKLIVDNSPSDVDNSASCVDKLIDEHTKCVLATHESCVSNTRNVCDPHTNRVETGQNSLEIIEEKSLLDSSRLILDSFKRRDRNVFPQEMGPEDIEKRKMELHKQALLIQQQENKNGGECDQRNQDRSKGH